MWILTNALLDKWCNFVQIGNMSLDEAILRHLAQQEIADQSVLLGLVREDGFETTLSTLSRHLRKLNVRKDQGVYRPAAPPRLPAPAFTLVKVRPCLIVLKTAPGLASALARALDSAVLPSMAGNLAGDDTVFAVPRNPYLLDALEDEIRARIDEH
jgi:transcriptional regulator of arginine metabolism